MKATRKENKIANEAPNYSVTPIYTVNTAAKTTAWPSNHFVIVRPYSFCLTAKS